MIGFNSVAYDFAVPLQSTEAEAADSVFFLQPYTKQIIVLSTRLALAAQDICRRLVFIRRDLLLFFSTGLSILYFCRQKVFVPSSIFRHRALPRRVVLHKLVNNANSVALITISHRRIRCSTKPVKIVGK